MTPRPFGHILLFGGLCLFFLATSWFALVSEKLLNAFQAEQLVLTLEGRASGGLSSAEGSIVNLEEIETFLEKQPGALQWTAKEQWFKEIRLRIPRKALADLQQVRVVLGPRLFKFNKEELLKEWTEVRLEGGDTHDLILQAPPRVKAESSLNPKKSVLKNWPGINVIIQATWKDISSGKIPLHLYWFALLFVSMVLVRLGLPRRRVGNWLFISLAADPETPIPPAESPAGKALWAWLGSGLALLMGAVVILEYYQPYYFTQDDNFSQFLPVILQGCHSLANGVLSTWNPYQLLGTPTSSLGVYSLTYPATYLAYFISSVFLRNEYLTLEVFALLHLLCGYFVIFWVLRFLGLRPMLAVAGSLSLVLSGYSLIAGRSWYYMLPVNIWVPLLMAAVIKMHKGPVSWRWALVTGLALGLFFHAGNAQMWIYAILFMLLAIAILVLTGSIPVVRALWVLPALLLGAAIAAPLLIPQLSVVADIKREGGWGSDIYRGTLALLFPFPITCVEHLNRWGNSYYRYTGQLYFSGTLFYLVGALAMSGGLVYKWSRKVVGENVWLICAGMAFLLALGFHGVLWKWLSYLPMFNKFNHPFKFLIFLNLFMVMGGGLVIERHLSRLKNRHGWELGLFLVVGVLLLYHVIIARPSFFTFGDHPYPPLPPALIQSIRPAAVDSPRRVISISPERNTSPNYVCSLNLNFASVFRVLSFDGYDPLVEGTPETRKARALLLANPIAACRAYGIRWLIRSPRLDHPVHGPTLCETRFESVTPTVTRLFDRLRKQSSRELSLPEVTFMDLPGAAPMAFASAYPENALPLQFNGTGAMVDTSSLPEGGSVVVNFLWRPEISVFSGDQLRLPASADEWGRIVVSLPAGTRTIDVRYCPPWFKGFLAGGALALAAMVFSSFLAWKG